MQQFSLNFADLKTYLCRSMLNPAIHKGILSENIDKMKI